MVHNGCLVPGGSPHSELQRVGLTSSQQAVFAKTCFHCGSSEHMVRDCPFVSAV